MTALVWTLLWLPVTGTAQITIHESSHAAVASAFGFQLTEFRPYPHFDGGHFYYGQMGYSGHATPGQVAFISAAPAITALALAVLVSALREWLSPDSACMQGLLNAVSISAGADLGNWIGGAVWRIPGSDGDDTLRALGFR